MNSNINKQTRIFQVIFLGLLIGFILYQGFLEYRNTKLQEIYDGQLIQGMEDIVIQNER